MRAEFAKELFPWLVGALIASLVALAYLIMKPVDTKSQATSIDTDGHPLTMAFLRDDELAFFDLEGNRIKPVPLDSGKPFAEFLNRVKGKITAGGSALLLAYPENPSCNITTVYGGKCYAPHAYCCN